MSGSECRNTSMNPDELEVAPGSSRQELQGWVPELASPDEIRDAMEKAFSYRGDVTITLKDGGRLEGYVFDRQTGATLEQSAVRLMPKDSTAKLSIPYSDIAGLAFSGRDTAAGKSWEEWARKYLAKRAAGEQNIRIDPAPLE